MQFVTFLGLAVCLGVLYLRARAAKGQPPRTTKQKLTTARVLVVALLVWLVISFNLQHLNQSLSGQPVGEQSAWERIVRFVAGGN